MGLRLPWFRDMMCKGLGGRKLKSFGVWPLCVLDHAGSVLPNIGMLHQEHDDAITSLSAALGVQMYEYSRDNLIEASSPFWNHSVEHPLPGAAPPLALPQRDQNMENQRVFTLMDWPWPMPIGSLVALIKVLSLTLCQDIPWHH